MYVRNPNLPQTPYGLAVKPKITSGLTTSPVRPIASDSLGRLDRLFQVPTHLPEMTFWQEPKPSHVPEVRAYLELPNGKPHPCFTEAHQLHAAGKSSGSKGPRLSVVEGGDITKETAQAIKDELRKKIRTFDSNVTCTSAQKHTKVMKVVTYIVGLPTENERQFAKDYLNGLLASDNPNEDAKEGITDVMEQLIPENIALLRRNQASMKAISEIVSNSGAQWKKQKASLTKLFEQNTASISDLLAGVGAIAVFAKIGIQEAEDMLKVLSRTHVNRQVRATAYSALNLRPKN